MSTENNTLPSYSDFQKESYEYRNQIALAGVKFLIMINGGAAVSLLAFLQAIIETNAELAKVTMIALLVLCAGVATAAACTFVIHQTVVAWQKKRPGAKSLTGLVYMLEAISILTFILGITILVIFGWDKLPK
jgi:hypothetical protein